MPKAVLLINFSNSLAIHQFTNQSKYTNLATRVCLETQMKHWTEAFPLYFDEISNPRALYNVKPHWWRICPILNTNDATPTWIAQILWANNLQTIHSSPPEVFPSSQCDDNRSFWINQRPRQWVLLPDAAFATLRIFHKSVTFFCSEWTWVPRFEPD